MKQKLKLLLLLFCLTFINCESKLNKGLVEAQLKDLQELGTSEYTLNKIIIAEDNQWYTIGDRKAVITMTASLKSGIDFSDIKITDMNTEEKSITLQLPKSSLRSLIITKSWL